MLLSLHFSANHDTEKCYALKKWTGTIEGLSYEEYNFERILEGYNRLKIKISVSGSSLVSYLW